MSIGGFALLIVAMSVVGYLFQRFTLKKAQPEVRFRLHGTLLILYGSTALLGLAIGALLLIGGVAEGWSPFFSRDASNPYGIAACAFYWLAVLSFGAFVFLLGGDERLAELARYIRRPPFQNPPQTPRGVRLLVGLVVAAFILFQIVWLLKPIRD